MLMFLFNLVLISVIKIGRNFTKKFYKYNQKNLIQLIGNQILDKDLLWDLNRT